MEELNIEYVLDELKRLIADKNFKRLKSVLAETNVMDLAEIFDDLSPDESIILLRLLDKDRAAEVFSRLSVQSRKDVVSGIHFNFLNQIIEEMSFDDKIDFFEEMPANLVKSLIAEAPQEERKLINQFLQYPDSSAGSLMTIEYVALKKHLTVKQSLEKIKSDGVDKETIYTCYVLDETRHLEGILSLRRIVLSDDDSVIGDIMSTDIISVDTSDDQEYVAEAFKKYDLMSAPVVDGEKRMVGIITIDDIMDVVERENTEDFQKMAAIAPSDDEYLDASVLKLAGRRIVWLLILMISATFSGSIITRYSDVLSMAGVLTVFMPLLMDSGGNAGSQSSTLVIRGMALGEIELKNWFAVFWKELRVGFVAGAALAVVNFGRMVLLTVINGAKYADYTMGVMITVSVTLMLSIVLAKLIGGLLPIVAKFARLDPAIMAGPLITTIIDAISLIIYFTIANALIF
ncbi:MAG: magnesium transporter [Clostridiales bacterium]|jgi:magnesium transporter|nr:magnesium transporter [Clostridiales bacterium]